MNGNALRKVNMIHSVSNTSKYEGFICLPAISAIPTSESCSSEYTAPPGQCTFQLFSWIAFLCTFFQRFSKITLLFKYIHWVNLVIYRQNYLVKSLVAFNDFFKLTKTARRFCVWFRENNYCNLRACYCSHVFFQLHSVLQILLVNESSDLSL